eukprot:2171103-Rhodomonas_salina.4
MPKPSSLISLTLFTLLPSSSRGLLGASKLLPLRSTRVSGAEAGEKGRWLGRQAWDTKGLRFPRPFSFVLWRARPGLGREGHYFRPRNRYYGPNGPVQV